MASSFRSDDAVLSGSLTQLSDGTSYLIAGAGIAISTGSNGSVTITNDGTVGDVTSVVAGSGLTGGGTTGDVTLNIGAGTGIDVAADEISVDVSDFMTNGVNNRVITATGTDAMNAEANLSFDGSILTVAGSIDVDGGAIFNESGNAVDFRVETDNKTHAIFADGSSNRVLILSGGGVTSPDESDASDINFFVSGSIGSRNTAGADAVAGTALFGGDVFVSGGMGINTVTVTTDGKLGIGTSSPSYKLEVGGNAAFGEYLYHRGDPDTFIQFAEDAIGIDAGGERFITISQLDAGQDIVKIGDGGDVDFQVRTLNDDNTLYVQGSSDRIGIGTNAPSSILHVKESSPTVTIQRESNANSSTLQFMGQAGAIANMVHMASTNDLVFSTHDGVDQEEILRLGSHYGTDVRQVILLSGSGMAASAMQPKEMSDINFFVSGAIDSKGTSSRGTAVFGGDMVLSGNLYHGASGNSIIRSTEHGRIRNLTEANLNTGIFLSEEEVVGTDTNQTGTSFRTVYVCHSSGSFEKLSFRFTSNTVIESQGGLTASFHLGKSGKNVNDLDSTPDFLEEVFLHPSSVEQDRNLHFVFSGSNFEPGDAYSLRIKSDTNGAVGTNLFGAYTLVISHFS